MAFYMQLFAFSILLFSFLLNSVFAVVYDRPSFKFTHGHNTTGPLHRRWDWPHPADDTTWDIAVCKGRNLINAIKETDRAAAGRFGPPPAPMTVQSQFRNFPQDFADWGWYQYDATDINDAYGRMESNGWGIADALRGIGVSDKDIKDDGNIRVAWMHHGPAFDDHGPEDDWLTHTYEKNGRNYHYTEGHFVYGMNPDEGVILGLDLKSPENRAPNWPPNDYPDLRRASDIMYGTWKTVRNMETNSNDLQSLRYYAVVGIVNAKTKAILVRAIEPDDITEYPGKMIWMNEDQEGNYNEAALGLLGAPTNIVLPYMLIQHKADFPDLRIVGVRVFLCNSNMRLACLLWYLKGATPAPPETPTAETPMPAPPLPPRPSAREAGDLGLGSI
ncbi:hypothetical protein P280DRAFT_547937 [Massarina eburnea CBS 473.64]|uniref:Uncharacterized protein n=1 Tax=Massarina eburnea CBS 473.64 TaxID=1395130 RepID=A0A6A6S6U6_9PLEO|nr:hypothetical protein P280DRAFT_547937 [Massarina eburnea CBS 473.64]